MPFIALAILSFSSVSLGGASSFTLSSAPTSWTLMMYMAGDWPPELPWEENLIEMETAAQTPQTNILALADPLGPNNTMLVKVEHQATPGPSFKSPVIQGSGIFPDGGDANMASPETLSKFIIYASSHYPAENLVLFLWGHGGDWTGLCPDSTGGIEIMRLPQLRSALENATENIGRILDMIVVDACTESSLEILSEVHGYTKYYAGSESNIPSTGLPYTALLNHLAAQGDGSVPAFGRSIVRDYVDWARYNSTYSATMALFDVTRIDSVSQTLNALSEQGAKYDSIFHGDLNTALTSSEHYANQWGVDFGDLMTRLYESNLPLEIRKTALDAYLGYMEARIVSEALNNPGAQDNITVHRATGATIYANAGGFADAVYADLQIAKTEWVLFGRLARQVAPTNLSAPGPLVTYGDTNSDGQPESVTLTWAQNYDSSSIWVFREDPSGGLVFIENVSVAGPHLTYGGHAGYLSISASASNGTVAQSHTSLKIALFGTISLDIRTAGGDAKGREFTVKATIRNSTLTTTTTNGEAQLDLTIPTQVSPGGLIPIQILDKNSRVLVGEGLAVVDEGGSTLTIIVAYPPSSGRYPAEMVLMALLPGLLILVYDLLLYAEDRRKK